MNWCYTFLANLSYLTPFWLGKVLGSHYTLEGGTVCGDGACYSSYREQKACRSPPPSLSPHDSTQIYSKFTPNLLTIPLLSPPQADKCEICADALLGSYYTVEELKKARPVLRLPGRPPVARATKIAQG